mmetsp:Transcript_1380/g.8536  ORF Transcript_1380/g.8536 Transcript_1380/m.8536 type:complete len:587 (+) Transcript_1380:2380-4140(+)
MDPFVSWEQEKSRCDTTEVEETNGRGDRRKAMRCFFCMGASAAQIGTSGWNRVTCQHAGGFKFSTTFPRPRWSRLRLWLLLLSWLSITPAQGSVRYGTRGSVNAKEGGVHRSSVSLAGLGLAGTQADAYLPTDARTSSAWVLSLFGGLRPNKFNGCGQFRILCIVLVFVFALTMAFLASFYAHGHANGGHSNWPVISFANGHVRYSSPGSSWMNNLDKKDMWTAEGTGMDSTTSKERSWTACSACTEGIGSWNSVCRQDGDNLLQLTNMTAKGKEGHCNLCQKCPNCEGCFVSAVPFDDFESFRKNNMFLSRMNDSTGVQYLAKVVPTPPVRRIAALKNVVDLCGFQDILPRERQAPFFAQLPAHEEFDAVAAANTIFSEMKPGNWMKIPMYYSNLTNSVNKTQVVRAAFFDFLFGAGDSGENNVLYNPETGSIYLIDTLHHGLCDLCHLFPGSIFYPGNLRFYAEYLDESSQLCNYQLYVQNGTVGRQYPPQLRDCLDNISTLDLHSLVRKYGMPSELDAKRFQERARWMQEGFEFAIWEQFCKYFAKSEQYKKFVNSLNASNMHERAQRVKDAFKELDYQHCDA